jgi:glycosyltransferase involved in cell wall biosynthesis
MSYDANGPAVMLGESTSLFPAQLAAHWRSQGIDVVLVTHNRDAPAALAGGTRVVRSADFETRSTRGATKWFLNPLLYRLERTVPRFKRRFERITGVSADTELWLPYFADYVAAAWPTIRAAQAQRPRFVFGHEVTTYGLPTALCRGVPRILLPWGGDVFTYAESSPFQFALTKFSLRTVDLVVPSSTTAARHIVKRFNVPPERVQALSWGVDRKTFRRADDSARREICNRWKIDPTATILLNPRRFRPDWGAFVALEAFLQIAAEEPLTHFVLFGGRDTENFTKQARSRVVENGLSTRFTLLEGDAPVDVCAKLMSVSDIFVSLLGRGDMRSASVLQAAAAGAAPVVSDLPEYREMARLGFVGQFVEPDNVDDVVKALRVYLQDPAKRRETVAANHVYLAEHEDYPAQMDKLLGLIAGVCSRYSGK